MRIGIDVMGGDNAPDEILKGCFTALANLAPDIQIVLIGDAGLINEAIAERGIKSTQIEVVGTTEVIGMDESPVDAVRAKKDSSLVIMGRMASPKLPALHN